MRARIVVMLLTAVASFNTWAQSAHSGPWAVDVIGENGQVLPTYMHHGRTYVLGQFGQRYDLRVYNGSSTRIEAVVSVDGRDVLDGQTASVTKRGYVVAAYSEVRIDGFRLNSQSVAAFRFSSVAESYAAQMGSARDVGVIGVAVFPEQPRPHHRRFDWQWNRDGSRDKAEAGGSADSLTPSEAQAAPAPPTSSTLGGMAKAGAEQPARSRPGLGTEFGEARDSAVEWTSFARASDTPSAVLALRYNNRAGLLALGIDVDRRSWRDDVSMRESAEPFRRDGRFATPPAGWRP